MEQLTIFPTSAAVPGSTEHADISELDEAQWKISDVYDKDPIIVE
jgi:hypothetical protein